MKPYRVLLLLLCAIFALLALRVGVRHMERVVTPEPLNLTIDSRPSAALPPLDGQEAVEPLAGLPPQAARDGKSRSKAAKASARVSHQPQEPRSGEPVHIRVDFTGLPTPGGPLLLEYQVVDPGKYIALQDPAYAKNWIALPLTQAGSVFEAELPGNLQQHRRLVRYRVRTREPQKVVAPLEGDSQPNYAYFVYDGIPAWKGAINPNAGSARLRTPVVYSSNVLQRVPVYHFISSKRAVEKVTWSASDNFGQGQRNAYYYTGTMVYDGFVYDHVGFRARGGSWRHAMGKNMWKFNFLPGHRFAARDDYGRPYRTKWDKLNLGACIQQGDYGMRGEQGMFEAVGFRLFNLAGMEASRTHWVHLRIIDEAEESPSDQYRGDFWGLYLAVENVDEHFLKEHELPPGNLYKMEFGAKTAFNGDPTVTDQSDVNEFNTATMGRRQPDSWWIKNLDLARYYNYRAILESIHHYDIDGGKNYFYYRNPKSARWIAIPWDIDLSWGESMYGGGHEPFYRSGILSRPPCRQQYQQRLAEIRDLLFNPEQTGRLIDEHAAMISDPKGGPSLVAADRAKWDYHPILASRYVLSMKAGQGRFYFGKADNTFQTMVRYMKSYVARRCQWIDTRLLGDYRPPDSPTIQSPSSFALPAPELRFSLEEALPPGAKGCQWRLAEVTDPTSPTFDPGQPWHYEIEALWEGLGPDPQGSVAIPTQSLVPGHTYRVRARLQDSGGNWSRWSKPVEFRVPGTGAKS